MTETRKPVTPAPVPMCQRGACQKPAEWQVQNRDGRTNVCTAHVGELLAPVANVVIPLSLILPEVEP